MSNNGGTAKQKKATVENNRGKGARNDPRGVWEVTIAT